MNRDAAIGWVASLLAAATATLPAIALDAPAWAAWGIFILAFYAIRSNHA